MGKASKVIATIIGMAMGLSAVSPAFAGEYQTTIEAFEYGPYSIPAYDGDSSEPVNENLPAFSEEELTGEPYVNYGELDSLGRCTTAESLLSESLMPTGKRGDIDSVHPSGWVQAKYSVVPAGWLYNRCHLIGWQLAGADLTNLTREELAKDLITGTRYLNVGSGSDGMVGYENDVAAYLKEDAENEVAYRVTPVFEEDNLVAYGVLMEGQSVASNDIEFCAFCYNVQPEIAIDYATGKSRLAAGVEENKNISECSISVGTKTVYTGKARKVAVTVKDGEKVLTEGADYKTVWRTNTLPGRASFDIVGVGAYKGTMTCRFIIIPAKAKISKLQTKKEKRKASIRIAVSRQKGVSGYQYSWRLSGKKWAKTSYRGNVRIIKKLKKGKVYQVRVRAYKKIDGKTYYGTWSKVKKIRTKK